MRNWKAIADASGLPFEDADRIVKPLIGLEEVFRPLVQTLTPDAEPAFTNSGETE